jgi:cGMP-dependent protein kinase
LPFSSLKSGDYFGEMALMLNETRHANVIAVTAVKCLHMNRADFDLLLGQVRQVLAKRMRTRILQSVPLLAKLSELKLGKLASYMRVQAFNDGTYIIREGEEGSRFYIINEGEVRCTIRVDGAGVEEELVRLYPQEFFGERALVTNEVRKANVIAVGQVECLVLDRSSFQLLLTEVHDDIAEVIEERERRSSSIHSRDSLTRGGEVEKALLEVRNHRLEDLVPMRTIGTGTFGRVKLVQHKSGEIFALKCINKVEVVNLHQEKNIIAEKNLLLACADCPFILRLYQTFNRPNQIFMLTEYIQGGEMWSYIYEKHGAVPASSLGGFDPNAVKFYIANVVLAFCHMHSQGIAYRDLKPENLLLDSKGYVKIVDFGFAKKLPYKRNGQFHDKTYTLCGTPE